MMKIMLTIGIQVLNFSFLLRGDHCSEVQGTSFHTLPEQLRKKDPVV